MFLEHVAKRTDLRCEADASNDAAPPPTLPSAMLTAVCRALSAVLDNCANRHLFVSSDYLSLLLGADDRELVAVVLETLMVLSRRPMEGTRQMSRWRPGQDLFKRLVAMTKGWGGKQQGLDMLACVAEGGLPEPLPEGPRSLRFQYYGAGTDAHGSAGNEGARGDEKLRVVQVAPDRLQSSTWRELAREHGVPADLMFSFGAAYHNARSFASLSARRRRVQERLQVYSVLLYCWVDASVVQFLQNSEPELASELTAVACMHGSGPDTQRLRSLGLGALAAFASDRSRTGATLAALGAGDTSSAGRGVLPHILQALKSGAEVASPGPSRSDSGESDPKRPRLAEPDTTEAYAEAALALVYSLMLTSHGLHALSGAGLVPALVPMLSDTSSAREGLVTAAVRSLESFIDFLPTSAQLFRELMGLDKAIKRIVLEIESADPGALAHPPQQCENVPAAPTAQVDGSQALRETTEGAEAAPAAGTLGYNKKRLLKALLRTVTVASYSPGASTRAVLENTRLPSCLTALLLRPRRFGGGIFSLAANMMSDILHQEPTCFGVLDAWGTPAALLKMVVQRGGLPVSAETLCCVPTSIVAICLNQAGLEAVRRSRALDSIVRMFTSPSYVKALAGDTASVLGSGLDELMRHAPDLRAEGVRATIDILRALAKAHEKVVEKLAAEERSETPVPCPAPGALPMVTDAGAVANPVAATDVVEEDSLRSGATGAIYAEAEAGAMALSETMLSDAVSNAVRLLESTLGSKDTSKEFVQQGGVQLLLQLYALPAMTSSNTPISATMAITFRSFGADNAGPVAKAVCDRTYFALKRASAELELLPWEGIAESGKDGNTNLGSAPDKDTTGLEADASEGGLPPALVRALRESECLLSLAAGHVRGSTAFQKELSKEHGLVFIEALGHVMCTTLWQSAARTRASIAQKGPEPNTSAHGAPGGSSGGAQSTEEDSGAPEGASGQNAAGTGDAGSAHPSEGRAGNAADAVRGKKTRPGTIATFTSAARGFLQAIVKAASSTSRREQFSPAVLHRTCAAVARTLTSTLLYKGPLAISDLSLGSPSAAEHELASHKALVDGIRREYVAAAAENADALLFDARRSTANAFLHGSLQENAVLEALRSVTLWATEEHVSVMSKKSEESEVQDPVLGADIEASSKAACYCLALFERLARAQLVLTGATATNNFIAARYRNVPGTPPPAAGQMTMFEIQSEAMGIATALWSREDFFSGIFDDAVVSAVLSLMSAATGGLEGVEQRGRMAALGTLRTPAAAPVPLGGGRYDNLHLAAGSIPSLLNQARAASQRRTAFVPSAAAVASICEMGFSEARARHALRQVGSDSLDLALEWIFSHPNVEPPPEPEVPSGADPAGAASDAAAAGASGADTDAGASGGASGVGAPNGGADGAVPAPSQVGIAPTTATQTGRITAEDLQRAVMAGQAAGAASAAGGASGGQDDGGHPGPNVKEAPKLPSVDYVVTKCCNLLKRTGGVLPAAMKLLSRSITGAPEYDMSPGRAKEVQAAARARADVVVGGLVGAISREVLSYKEDQRLLHCVLLLVDGKQNSSSARAAAASTPRAIEIALKVLEDIDEGAGEAQQQLLATAALLLAAFSRITTTKPSASSGIGASGGAGAGDAKVSGLVPAATSGEGGDNTSPDDEREKAMKVLVEAAATTSPQGVPALGEGARGQALAACLQRLTAERPPSSSVLQALCSLLGPITRDNAVAVSLFRGGGVRALLRMPAASTFPGYDAWLRVILRHCLEDPVSLRQAMEAEIRSYVGMAVQRQQGVPLRAVLSSCTALIERDPSAFASALAAVCDLKTEPSGRCTVVLHVRDRESRDKTPHDTPAKPAKPEDVQQSKPRESIGKLALTPVKPPAKLKSGREGDKKAKAKATPGGKDKATPAGKDRDRSNRKTPPGTFLKVVLELVELLYRYQDAARALESGSASAMDVDRGEEEAGAADESLKELKEAEKHAAHRALFALGAIADFSMLFPSTFAPAVSRIERDPQHGIPFKKESEKERERTKGKGKEKALDANATESTSLLSLLFNVLLPSALGERRGDAAIRQAIANRAGTALVAVSLMSAEGRRRVLRSISDKLSSPLEAPADERMKLAVTCRPTLDLITAMVTTGSNGGVVSADNIKAITDARVAEALGTVLQAVDLHHPQAPALVSAILKPLDALARAALAAANKADPRGRAAGARRDAGRALESTAADLERIRANINALGSTVAELTGGRPGSAARAGAEGGVGDPLAVGRDPAADTADDGEGRAAGSTAPRGRGGEGRAGGNGDAEPLDELAVAMNEGTALTDLAAAMQETAQATYSDGYGPSGLGGAGGDFDSDDSSGVDLEDDSDDEEEDSDDEDEDDEDEEEDMDEDDDMEIEVELAGEAEDADSEDEIVEDDDDDLDDDDDDDESDSEDEIDLDDDEELDLASDSDVEVPEVALEGPGQAEADEGIEEDYDDDDGMGEEIEFPDEDLEQQMGGGMTGGWHILGDDDGSGNPPTGVQGDLPLMDGVHGLPPGATMSIRDAPDGQSHRVIELRLPQGFAGLLDGAEREGLSFGQSFFETVTAQARAALDSFDTIAGQPRENTGGGSARDRDVLSAPHPLLQDQPAEGAGGARPADAATGSVPFGGLRQARHGGLAAPRFHRARPLDDETGQAIRRRAGAQGVRLFDFSDDQVTATGPAESLLNAGGAPGQYVVVQEGMAPSSARVVMVGGPQGPAASGGRNDGRLAHVGRDTATIPPPLMIESAHAISRAAAESRATRWRGQLPAARADQTSAGPPLHGMPTGGMPEDVVMRFMRASGSVVEDAAPAPGVAAAAAAAIAEAAPVPELWPASGTAHGVVAAGDDGIAPMRAEADNPPAERAQTTTDPRTTSDADGGADGTQEASLRPAEPSAQPQPPSEPQQEPLAEAEEEMVDGDGADEENEDAAGGPADGARASAEAGGDMPAQDAQVRVPGLAEAARCDADGAAEETRADEVSGDGVPAEEPAGEPVGDSAGVPAGAPAGEATAEPAGAPDGAEGSEMPSGVDPSFLEALPPELRAEVMATQVPQIEREHQRRRAASNDAGRGSQPAARDAPEGGTSGAGTDLDPEFLSALPPELQAEVMAQSRAAARAPPSRPAQPDNASIVASFPRELREEVFLTADDAFIASLPPSLRAEAEAARRRAAEAAARRNQAAPPATHEGLGRGRWRAPMPGGVRGTSSLVPGPPGLATGSDPRRGNNTAGEGVLTETMPVLLGENALASVLSLLRMATPLPGGKTQLQRLLLYLSSNAEVAKQIVWKLALMFRPELTAPVGASEAERAVIEAASAAFDAVRLPTDPVSKKAAATGMFGSNSMIAAAVDESGSPTSVPPVVTRRALETAAYLCKGSDTVGELCIAPLPASEEVARVSKGKGKADEADASEQKSPSALGLMLKVLGVPVYTRSSAQLESALAFLEQVLKVADRDAMRRSESRFAKVQAAAERVSLEAHRAALRAALARDAGPAGQSTEAVEAAARSAQDGTPGASGGGSGTQASAADELKGLTGPADEILPGVGETDLRRVPALLAVPGLTDLAYAKVADVMKLLTACHAPSLELFITELGAAASDMHEDVAAELQRVASRAEAAGDASGTGAVGGAGAGLLRVLQAMRMLTTRADAVEASRARLQKALAKARAARGVSEPPGDDDLAGLAPGGAQKRRKLVQDVARSLEPALAKLSVAASAVEAAMGVRKDKTPGRPKAAGAPPSPATLPPAANDLLPFIQSFFALCEAAGLLPPKPDADTERERKPHGAFASGATRGAAGRNEEIEPSSVMMIRTTSLGAAQMAVRAAMAERDGTPLTPAGAGSSRGKERDEGRLVFSFDSNDEGGAFVKFCETHRTLINAYVRQAKALEGPLEPLARVPRLLDFDNKRAFFRHRVRQHAAGERGGTLRVNVRRAFVLEDSFHQLRMRTPAEMRGKLQVQFAGEEGIDAGGLTREWFGCLCKEIFKANYALFSSSSAAGTTFQPNPLSYVNSEHLSYFKFVGRIVGKAIYDGHLMDAHFTRSFYKHMLGMPMTFHDVEAVDPAFYKTLVWMLDNDITDVLDLTFTAEADEFAKHLFGEDNSLAKTVELKPGGAEIAVTEENKHEYVALISEYKMIGAIRTQMREFLSGFHDIVPRHLISIFDDNELELLLSGLPEVDLDDMRAHTDYHGYSAGSKQITWFWDVVRSLESEDLARLLLFITGTSKVPLEGFAALAGIQGPQRFNIHRVQGETDRLPAAHTCFNQLDLPEYESRQQLKEKLLTAIQECAGGFGFG